MAEIKFELPPGDWDETRINREDPPVMSHPPPEPPSASARASAELMTQRRQAYQAMTRDPDFISLRESDPQAAQEVSRKVLYPDQDATSAQNSVSGAIGKTGRILGAVPAGIAAIPGAAVDIVKTGANAVATAPQFLSEVRATEERSPTADRIGRRLYETPGELLRGAADTASLGLTKEFGVTPPAQTEGAKALRTIGGFASFAPLMKLIGGGVARKILAGGVMGGMEPLIEGAPAEQTVKQATTGAGLMAALEGARHIPEIAQNLADRGLERRFRNATDITPEAPLGLPRPEARVSDAVSPEAPTPGPAPQIMSPAQTSAGVFERQLAAEQALMQSDRGAKLLRAQLLQQQGEMPQAATAPAAITPEVIPPARAAAIAKGKARVKKPAVLAPTEITDATTQPAESQAPAVQTAAQPVEAIPADGQPPVEVPAATETAAVPEAITAQANEAATSPLNELPLPTQSQIEAGNYKKGHTRWQGFDVTIENPEGSVRSGTGPGGEPWSVTMPAHYGYIKRTNGADGEQIDVYLGNTPSDSVFVVDQMDADTGKWDEHKVIGNVASLQEAQQLYDAGFSDQRGPERRGNITQLTKDEFKDWVKNGETTKPIEMSGVGQIDDAQPLPVRPVRVRRPQPFTDSSINADPLDGFTDEDILGLVKSGLQKQTTGEILTKAEFAAIEKFNGQPTQPWVEGPRTTSSLEVRQKNRARVAAELERRAELMKDLQATIDDLSQSQVVRDAARAELEMYGSAPIPVEPEPDISMTMEAAPADETVKNFLAGGRDAVLPEQPALPEYFENLRGRKLTSREVQDVFGIGAQEAYSKGYIVSDAGGAVITGKGFDSLRPAPAIDISQATTQINTATEVAHEPGQPGPNPSQLDVREPTGNGAGTNAPEQANSLPGGQNAASVDPGAQVETGAGDVGAGSVRPGSGDDLSPSERPAESPDRAGGAGTGITETGADAGAGTVSDLPETLSATGRPGPQTGEQQAPLVELDPNAVNHVLPSDHDWIPTGDRAKIKANLAAIYTLKKLERENRNAYPGEKEILAKYVGWGGLKPVFDIGKEAYRKNPGWTEVQRTEAANWEKNWGKAWDDVKAALSREEWASAAASIENAHYTSREVINGVWKAVERLGFSGGNALEPASGNGNFIGLEPTDLASYTRWKGIELDDITGRIAKKLYPQAKIEIGGFESAKVPLNSQDLVISNVPFSSAGPKDSRYPNLSLHNYFFVRGLDLLRPGGLMAAITSTSTMDNPGASDLARQEIGNRADLIAAIRLPNNAFQKNAGTEVTTDILFLRKRDLGQFQGGQPWRRVVDTQTAKGEPIQINEYYLAHPEMMLGQMALESTMYGAMGGKGPTLSPLPGVLLRDQLNEAIGRLPEGVIGKSSVEQAQPPEVSTMERLEGQQSKPGNIVMAKGGHIVRITESGASEYLAWSEHPQKTEQARRYINVRDIAQDMIIRQFDPVTTDAEIIQDRAELNRVYDAYVKKYGPINNRASAFLNDDGDFFLPLSLENSVTNVTETFRAGKPFLLKETTWVKSPMFTQRTLFPREAPTHVDTVVDALQVSINYRGGVDIDYIAKLTGLSTDQVAEQFALSGDAFENPKTGIWEERTDYLSGFVKDKLAEAESAALDDPRFLRNVDELKTVQPAPISMADIGFKLGSKWMPPETIEGFVKYLLDVDVKASYTPETSSWNIRPIGGRANLGSAANLTMFGIHDWRGDQIVESSLNLKQPVVYDEYRDEYGVERKERNDTKTTEVRGKQDEIQGNFKDYVLSSREISAQLEQIYNEAFNGTVIPTFRAPSWKHYPGASTDVTLMEHQKSGASRLIKNSTLLANGVGTGKTYIIITAAMEQRRLGLAKKPMIVVQNATMEQFAAAFRKLYPAAKLYAPNATARNGLNRKTAMARIATGDWDAVIVPQSWYNRISDDPKRVEAYIQDQIEIMENAVTEARRTEGRRSPRATDIQRLIRSLREQLQKLADRPVDDALPFEQLGVDSLFVDEAHEYKKLQFFSQMDNIKGLDRTFSQRGLSMLMKVRFVQDKNQGRNVTFATGTPVSNTIAEAWTMMRYLRPDLLKQYQMENFDSFAALFGDNTTNTELTAAGTWKQVTRFAKFINGPELIAAWRTMADVKTNEDINLPGIPSIKGGQGAIRAIPQSAAFADYVLFLRSELERYSHMSGREKIRSGIPVTVTTLAKKASLDMRLVRPGTPDDPGSKLNIAADEAFRIYTESTPVKGTQMMFADNIRDNPKHPTFNAHEELKKKLIERGIPANEIVVLDDKIKDERRDMIFSKFNEGEIRIAIGTTKRMGIGVNAQKHMIGLHHLDAPWRPMDMEQREGRILRQGNENPEVEIITYGVDRSLDAATFQLLATKQRFTNQILRGEITGRNFEDSANAQSLSYEQQMAAFSGDPRAMEKVGLEHDVGQLTALRRGHIVDVAKGKTDLEDLNTRIIPSLQREIATTDGFAADYAAKFPFGTDYTATINGVTVPGKKDVVAALDAYFKQKMAEMEATVSAQPKRGTIETNDFSEVTLNGAKIFIALRAAKSIETGKVMPEASAMSWYLEGSPTRGSARTGQGLFQGLTGQLEAIGRRPTELKNELASKERSARELTGFVDKPFMRDAELAEKAARLAILTAELEAEGETQTSGQPQVIDASQLTQQSLVDTESGNNAN